MNFTNILAGILRQALLLIARPKHKIINAEMQLCDKVYPELVNMSNFYTVLLIS
jgi:hypothetical protein